MKSFKSICILFALFSFYSLEGFGKTLDKLLPFLGNPNLDVQSYHFNIDIPTLNANEFQVRMEMEVLTLEDASEIELHTNQKLIQVENIYVNGKRASHAILQGISGKPEYGLSGDVLSIEDIRVKANYLNNVVIVYSVKLSESDRGFYSIKNNNLTYLLTRNWPYYGRFWFPSNDTPLDAAKVSYAIKVPKDYMGIANGALVTSRSQSNFSEFLWEQETPTTTYNFAFAIGKFARHYEDICFNNEGIDNKRIDCKNADNKIPLEIYYNPQNQEHLETVKALKKDALAAIYFSKLFGKYEFEKLGFLLSDYPFNMESTSLIVLHDQQAAVHEIVHHWWGNNVHIPHWGDFWISEGFTTYVTGLYTEYLIGTNDSCLDFDSPDMLNNPQSTDPSDIFNAVPYCKGAASIHDLRVRLSASIEKVAACEYDPNELCNVNNSTKAFLKMLSHLYKAYKAKALSTENFVNFVNENAMGIYASEGIKLDQKKFREALSTWSEKWYQE